VERRNKGGGACSPRQNIKPIIIGKEVIFPKQYFTCIFQVFWFITKGDYACEIHYYVGKTLFLIVL